MCQEARSVPWHKVGRAWRYGLVFRPVSGLRWLLSSLTVVLFVACSLTSSLDDLKGGPDGGGGSGGDAGDGQAGDGSAATGNTGGGTAADGSACGTDGECQSAHCVDGVCCNTACDSDCMACTSALKGGGVDGECGPSQAGTDPREDCTDDGVASCGNDGRCDGKGACRKYAAGLECAAQTCTGGVKSFAKTCDGSGACQDNGSQPCQPASCNGVVCTGDCAGDNECQPGEFCDIASGDCTAKLANGAACQPSKANQCASGQCVDGVCCDTACTGACQSCKAAFTGAADGTCAPVATGTDPDGECADQGSSTCGTDGVCDGAGACRKYAVGTVCKLGSCAGSTLTNPSTCSATGQCQPNGSTACAPYLCGSATTCGTTCSNDAQCVSGNACDTTSGTCGAKKPNGQPCSSGNQCTSGFCVDGVCCESACTGACKACSTAKKGSGADGTCGNVGNGLDPDDDCADQGAASCGTNGACNGSGACALYASGTQCAAGSCSGSTKTNPSTCNGTGTCSAGGTSSCGAYMCSGANCGTSCSTDTQCTNGNFCQGGLCGGKKGNGSTCSAGSECSSNFCVDGFCCSTACTGLCQACANALTGAANGTCASVPNGQDPQNECAAQAASTCGTTGACNGSGACALYAAGTQCVAPSCSGSTTLTAADTCNGSGTCVDNGIVNCSPYVCAANACKTSCTSSTDCASGYYCNGTTCQAGAAPNGTACTSPAQCASGFCVDGYCCNSSCTGVCKTCNGAYSDSGVNGSCDNVGECSDPYNECSGSSICSFGKCWAICP